MGKTYKIIEIVGTSSESYEDAIRSAVAEASKSLKGLSWFEVVQTRGGIKDGKVEEYQVILKVGFRLLD
jgi:flavin-binding protein dodecin